MTKRLISFFLLLMMTGSVLAGNPLHSGEKECSMGGMTGEMDCCATARMRADRPEVRAARLCCALNCSESGETTRASAYKVSPQLTLALHNALVPPAASPMNQGLPQAYAPPGLRQSSSPAYIRHLALLI